MFSRYSYFFREGVRDIFGGTKIPIITIAGWCEPPPTVLLIFLSLSIAQVTIVFGGVLGGGKEVWYASRV